MAKHNKNDYFELIQAQTGCAVRAATLLVDIFNNYSYGNVAAYKDQMHVLEHEGDEVHHDILHRLSAEFITPIDQEDILHLVQILDDVIDAVDEVVMCMYVYCIEKIPAAAPNMAKFVLRCITAMNSAAAELKNFKKPQGLRRFLIEVNDIEGEADKFYADAMRELFCNESDGKVLIGNKKVYDSLEECCDLCEHAADVIEQIIIKNT